MVKEKEIYKDSEEVLQNKIGKEKDDPRRKDRAEGARTEEDIANYVIDIKS